LSAMIRLTTSETNAEKEDKKAEMTCCR
jgi:hypothetical protein